jgi:hypothetical protein
MSNAKKLTGLVLLVALVGVGAVLYFGFFKAEANNSAANVNKTPDSKFPAKEHILGLDTANKNLDEFMKAEYDRQNAECKQQNPNTELAMGVTHAVRDSFASVSLGCGETGNTGYYAKIDNVWQLAFKAEDVPKCEDVNKVKFTKEIIPECETGGAISDNQNP